MYKILQIGQGGTNLTIGHEDTSNIEDKITNPEEVLVDSKMYISEGSNNDNSNGKEPSISIVKSAVEDTLVNKIIESDLIEKSNNSISIVRNVVENDLVENIVQNSTEIDKFDGNAAYKNELKVDGIETDGNFSSVMFGANQDIKDNIELLASEGNKNTGDQKLAGWKKVLEKAGDRLLIPSFEKLPSENLDKIKDDREVTTVNAPNDKGNLYTPMYCESKETPEIVNISSDEENDETEQSSDDTSDDEIGNKIKM